MPPSPTIQPRPYGSAGSVPLPEASGKNTPCRSAAVTPGSTRVHAAPPSVVRRMSPPLPTIQPLFAFWKKTSLRPLPPSLSIASGVQPVPPLVVRRARPALPTTTPTLAVAKSTALSVFPVEFDGCAVHVLPALLVTRMVPCAPTIQPLRASTKCTPRRLTSVATASDWSTQP